MSYKGGHGKEYIPEKEKGDKIQMLESSIFNGEMRKGLDNGDGKQLRLEGTQKLEVPQKFKFGESIIRSIKCSRE